MPPEAEPSIDLPIDPQAELQSQTFKVGLEAAGFYRRRRMFLAKALFTVVGTASAIGMIKAGYNADEHDDANIAAEVEHAIPSLDEGTLIQAQEFTIYDQLHRESKKKLDNPSTPFYNRDDPSLLGTVEDLTDNELDVAKAAANLADSINPETVAKWTQSYHQYQGWYDARTHLTDHLLAEQKDNAGNFESGYALLSLSLLSPLLALSKGTFLEGFDGHSGSGFSMRPQRRPLDGLLNAKFLAEYAKDLTPNMGEPLPSKTEVAKYFRKIKMLPPIGAKIVTIEEGKFVNHPQTASYSADSLVRGTHLTPDKYGSAFVHQLTVQGRLPDRFKYAAVTLLMNSPIENDWDTPFYNAHWGSIGPLVHDGGNTQERLNKHWKKVPGRTDFLQRIVLNFDEDKNDETSRETAILANQAESMRMITEARFYQRAALALHCAEGTAPKHIPKTINEQLARLWEDYETRMKKLLTDTRASPIVDSTWFLDEPQPVGGWPTERYEAEYEPIKDALTTFEASKRDHPEIREIASRAMVDFTDKVDAALDKALAA